jgi:hypothetical protein
MLDTAGEAVRVGKGGVIFDAAGIEHDHVCKVSRSQAPAVAEAEIPGRQAREPPDRLLERQPFFVPDVTTEEAGEASVGPWMRVAAEKSTAGSRRLLVRADRHPGTGNLQPQVLLGHHRVGDRQATLVFDDQIDHRLDRAAIPGSSHGGKSLTDQ